MQKLNFNNISFKYKIIWVILSVLFITLLTSVIIYIHFGKKTFEKNTKRELILISDIISNNCVAPILFKDTIEAFSVLHSLAKHPNIKVAAIFDTTMNLFAKFPENFDFSGCTVIKNLHKDTVIITDTSYLKLKSIIDESENNKIIGFLLISRNLKDYTKQFSDIVLTNLIIALTLLILAFILTTQLQKIISQPILNLSSVVKKITANKDFTLRINKRGNDEVGQLIDGFNQMLDTIELQNKELTLSKDEAIKLAKAKQQFLANMSHEIRTPMNAIIGMINLLLNTPLTPEQKEYLNHIDLSANNLLVIINDILDISKIESGKITFERYRFNINDTIDNIYKMFEPKVVEKGITFIVKKDPCVANFWIGDQVRLNQILINLVGNAVKFTLQGQIMLEITAKKTHEEKIWQLFFTVSDTGIGIPIEKQANIFESFTQASSDTTRRFGGTGLGLAISKQLVELQGGKIWFESEPNKGTKFYFFIPYEKAKAPTLEEIQMKSEYMLPDCISANFFTETRILIVEDNKINQFLLKTILNKQNFINVFIVNNGKEAIEFIQQNEINIILLDLHMPEMDGYETTRYIRSHPNSKIANIPIVAVTAAVIQGEKEKCMEAGMNEYISKPFKADELFNVIIKLLSTNYS
ncbi:MAG: ATP-binding protein [Bacteroidales bacterium]|nr:ATP-binding protein [Bacteroidales bacterium]